MAQAERQEGQQSVQWLLVALQRMIQPIVKMAIGHISCSALIRMLRETYIREVYAHLEKEGKRPSKAAVALLSGLDGRTISNILQERVEDSDASEVCPEAAILEIWQQAPEFLDEDGKPADLPVAQLTGEASKRTFTRLARTAAGRHVTANVALARLMESGNVECVEDQNGVEHARMVNHIYMPVREDDKKTAMVAGSFAIAHLGKSVQHNIQIKSAPKAGPEEAPPWLQQDRWSVRICPQRLPVLRERVRALLKRQILEVEQVLIEEEEKSKDAVEVQFEQGGVGWYYWEASPRESENE